MFAKLQLFVGHCSTNEARVYASVPVESSTAGTALAGTIRGPHLAGTSTLPAGFHFRDLGPGKSILAEAIVTEPAFWTPRSPYLYAIHLELQRRGQFVAEAEREIGLRPLGTKKNSFYLSGKRWVLRGVAGDPIDAGHVPKWIQAWAVPCTESPSEVLCQEASRQGLPLVAIVPANTINRSGEIRRLSNWPAVVLAILEGSTEVCPEVTASKGNLLLAQRCPDDGIELNESSVDAVIVSAANLERVAAVMENCEKPMVLWRHESDCRNLEEARRACDVLQRDFAPVGDFAGYVVDLSKGWSG